MSPAPVEDLPPVAPALFELGPAGTLRIGDPATLAASRCPDCGRAEFPRVMTCPACGRTTVAIALERGTLAGSTTVLHAPPGALLEVPYDVGVVEFECDLSVLGVLIGIDPADLGRSVEVRATRVGDRAGFAFAPDATAAPHAGTKDELR